MLPAATLRTLVVRCCDRLLGLALVLTTRIMVERLFQWQKSRLCAAWAGNFAPGTRALLTVELLPDPVPEVRRADGDRGPLEEPLRIGDSNS